VSLVVSSWWTSPSAITAEAFDKSFKTNLNLIQAYKSLSIAEGMRLEPNNPVFLLKGKK